MKHLKLILPVLSFCILLSGCGGDPGWDGSTPKNKTGEFAKESCNCIYQVMAEMESVDVDKILDDMEDFRKRGATVPDMEKTWPAIFKALEKEEEISQRVDDSECYKPIDEKAFNEGVDFEAMMDEIDAHCLLGMFYN